MKHFISIQKKIRKKNKSMISKCFEDFGKSHKKKKNKLYNIEIFPSLEMNTKDDGVYFYYIFYAPGLRKNSITVSYKDNYLTIERRIKRFNFNIIVGNFSKNSIKRISSKSFYIKESVEDEISYGFKGDKLFVCFKKKIQ